MKKILYKYRNPETTVYSIIFIVALIVCTIFFMICMIYENNLIITSVILLIIFAFFTALMLRLKYSEKNAITIERNYLIFRELLTNNYKLNLICDFDIFRFGEDGVTVFTFTYNGKTKELRYVGIKKEDVVEIKKIIFSYLGSK